MALTEIQALIKLSEHKLVKNLLQQMKTKKDLQKELEEEDLSVMREMEINSHIKTIDNNVQKVRMDGLL